MSDNNTREGFDANGRFAQGNQVGKSTQFTSDNQPKNGGRKGKAISQYLKQIGEGAEIKFNITIDNGKGEPITRKGTIKAGDRKSKNPEEDNITINEVLASLMWVDAIKGDKKTRREILDRVEGRPASYLDITSKGEVLQLDPNERRGLIEKLSAKLLKKIG